MGSGVHPSATVFFEEPAYGDNLHWRLSCHKRHPWRYGGGARPMRRPASGVGRFHGVCWAAYVKTSRCLTLRPLLTGLGDGVSES
ncbi:hypothetical protein [Desulfosporosinus acidiphilus]|uniref:hypothetical protein n=1 Tax=Desulfosporosinus acidiphilus TaxID=885581 RepID=UPI0011D1DAF2|nr:hypothetical protein [Desulfosporosinus acidiphilus]